MYHIEYNGSSFEEATEIGALQCAKGLIEQAIGPVADWAVVHDEVINVWFVRSRSDGQPVGATATVTGPEPTVTSTGYPAHVPAVRPAPRRSPQWRRHDANDLWLRRAMFVGTSPAETFYRAYAWIADQQNTIAVSDVGWDAAEADRQFRIKVYYHDLTS